MKESQFLDLFWKQYLMIEKELKSTTKFIAIDVAHFTVYSDVYAKLLLQIGSEVDIVAKELCKMIDPKCKVENMSQYKTAIFGHFPYFSAINVEHQNIVLSPWKQSQTGLLEWWKAYNTVKHNRYGMESIGMITQEGYKFANQRYVLDALAALYQLELYLYSMIDHDQRMDTPMPGSRLFKLQGRDWDNKTYYQDMMFYLDNEDGCLYLKTSDYIYSEL